MLFLRHSVGYLKILFYWIIPMTLGWFLVFFLRGGGKKKKKKLPEILSSPFWKGKV